MHDSVLFDEDVKSDYDPLISGLEPASFETIFKELFTGIKQFMGEGEHEEEEVGDEEEEEDSGPEEWNSFPDENDNDLILCWQPELPMPDCTRPHTPPFIEEIVPSPKMEKPAKVKKTRQYTVLRCQCQEDFPSQFSLEFHETKHHPELFHWFCSECKINFKTLQQASDHLILTHKVLKMPVFGDMFDPLQKPSGPLLMQSITRRSTDFTREFLESRGIDTIMNSAYYLFAKCELQAVVSGNIGLSVYNQAKTDFRSTVTVSQYEDFVACLRSTFIYGKYIKRVSLSDYCGAATVYKKLTFTSVPVQKPSYQHGQMVGGSSSTSGPRYQQFGQGPLYRVGPYPTDHQVRMAYTPSSRARNYTLAHPPPARQNTARRVNIRNPAPPRYNPYQFQSHSH